jgi:hypothetical protein
MGRHKVDYALSTVPCDFCGKMGLQIKKGACNTCYAREYHRKSATFEAYKIKRRENSRQWNKENPETYKANKLRWRLASTYGLTVEQYKAMEAKQKGVCSICGGVQKNGMLLSVDHDHETNKVRELLCNRCNFVVGNIETTPSEILTRIFEYLEKYPKEVTENVIHQA